jgi:hypothetical protein
MGLRKCYKEFPDTREGQVCRREAALSFTEGLVRSVLGMAVEGIDNSQLIDFLQGLLQDLQSGKTVKAALDVQALIYALRGEAPLESRAPASQRVDPQGEAGSSKSAF